VQRYLHDLTGEMGEQLDAITSSLSTKIVTATTLQFSYQLIETKTQAAVNAFWFASLVFRYCLLSLFEC
jgi:hypothetical protein